MPSFGRRTLLANEDLGEPGVDAPLGSDCLSLLGRSKRRITEFGLLDFLNFTGGVPPGRSQRLGFWVILACKSLVTRDDVPDPL